MPDLIDHQSSEITKLLLIGNSGSGKTGALASLAQAGYNLRILDFDSGLDVLANLLKSGKYGPEALSRVKYETLTDPMKKVGDKLVPKSASVWQRTIGFFEDWGKASLAEAQRRARQRGEDPAAVTIPASTAEIKGILTWTPREVLVIDSLTFLSKAALNLVLSMNARLGQKPFQSDWGDGQMLVEQMLASLYDENVRCNVIVTSHITFIGEENGPQYGYPSCLGKALPPKVGTYFNTALMAKTSGVGANLKRMIHTTTVGAVELKNTSPTAVRKEYPLESGLAEYFRDVRGPIAPAPAPAPAK